MDRRSPFYRQLVADTDVTQWFDDAEAADRRAMSDPGFAGVMTGLVASEHSPNDYSVDITGGTAYDQLGQRIHVPSTQNVDLSVDHANVTTSVASAGKSKIVSIFIKFNRALSNPKTDGNGATVYYDRSESFSWYIKQGAEATTGSQVPPAKEADGVLIANITLTYTGSPAVIVNGMISTTTRDDLVVLSGSSFSVRRGRIIAALQDIVDRYNTFVAGSVDRLAASKIDYAGGGSWAGGTSATNPSTTVEAQFDKIIADLAATTSGASGADRTASASIPSTVGGATIASGTLYSVLTALKLASNLDKGAGPAWADSSTNGAAALSAYIDAIITRLASTSSSPGAQAVGMHAVGNFTATNLYAAFTQVTATTASADGASKVGAEAKGSFTTLTVRGQLDELDTTRGKLAGANAWTAANTFTDITAVSGGSYKLSSRSVTRTVPIQGMFSQPLVTGAQFAGTFVLPQGAVLTAFNVYLTPNTHSAWPPATKATVLVGLVDVTTGASSSSTGTDAASNLSQGNATRAVSVTGLSMTCDRTKDFFQFILTNESGANAQGCSLILATATYTVTSLDDGG